MAPTCHSMKAVQQEAHDVKQFLSADNFALIEKQMVCAKFSAGNMLFWEGDAAEYLYTLYSGQVKVGRTTEDGKELIFYMLQQGDFFGEFGGFAQLTHQFTAQAMSDVEVGMIAIRDLEQLIASNGSLALEFMKWMGLLQRKTESKFRDLLLYGKTGALASTLIRLSNSYGKLTPEGIQITIKLTNTEIANMIGTARESVNRMLGDFKSSGVLSIEHGIITIHKLQALKEVVACPDCPDEICRI